jgi:hypothetical protein
LSVPYRPGTTAYRLQGTTKSRSYINALPHALQLRTLPLCRGGFRRCHVSYSSRPCLPVEVGFDSATCPMASDPAPLLKWAPVSLRVPWLQTSLLERRGLWHRHVSQDSGPRFPVEMGSSVVTCPTAPDRASMSGMALALSRVLRYPMGRVPHE